jgi:UPF0271 protein
MKLDLNCDLGEGEPLARTRALMQHITSANVACGGHAGDARTMQACIRLARAFDVRLGAHPGPWSRADFGRGPASGSARDLELLLLQQVGALERLARAEGVRLHHVKLHGALNHASEASESLARGYVGSVRRWWPRTIIYARAGGHVAVFARRAGMEVWEEVFADRGYNDDGSLVARGAVGALVSGARRVTQRVELLRERGEIEALSGRRLVVTARTIGLHADTPDSVALARAISMALCR